MSAASLLGSRAALSGASVATSTANARRHSFSAAARFTTRAAISQPPSGGEAEANTERAKVSMVSLGCPKNTVDGEVMLGDLFANGFDVIDDDPYSTDTIDPSKHPDFAGRERNKPIPARSLRAAFDICEDGNRILLLRGVHNGCGAVCDVDKRVVIRAEGGFREAVVDARNNSPIFRIQRPCVLMNLDIDFTGFSEAIRVEGKLTCDPLIEHTQIICSG